MLIEAAQIQRCISIIFKLRAINKKQMHTEIIYDILPQLILRKMHAIVRRNGQ